MYACERYRPKVAGAVSGIIDSQSDSGGWPDLEPGVAPENRDRDGLPDEWEKSHGLSPNDPNDASMVERAFFTQLEVYLNSHMTDAASVRDK